MQYQNSVILVYDCQDLSEINNRTYLSTAANANSIDCFCDYDIYTGNAFVTTTSIQEPNTA